MLAHLSVYFSETLHKLRETSFYTGRVGLHYNLPSVAFKIETMYFFPLNLQFLWKKFTNIFVSVGKNDVRSVSII